MGSKLDFDQGVSKEAAAAIKQQSASLNQSLGFGGCAGVAFFYLVHGVALVPIVGTTSLTRPGAVIGATAIGALFFAGFLQKRDRKISPNTVGLYFNSLILALAAAAIGFTALGLVGVTMENAFPGIAFDPVTASLLIAGAGATIAYLTLRFTQLLTIQRIYAMLVIVLFGGILISAIASEDSGWYHLYVSALGMSSSGAGAKIFNFALVFSGILLIAMANLLFGQAAAFYNSQPKVGPKRYHTLYILFILCGLCLAGVGAFPFVQGTIEGRLHQLSAGLLGVVFFVWMAGLKWLIPLFDRSFYTFSLFTAAGMAAIFLLAVNHIYFTLTGLELSVFVIASAWLSLYLTNMFNAAKSGKSTGTG